MNYNISNNSLGGNLSAWQIDQNGFTFNPSLSVMLFPEQTTNFIRGKGFNNNDAVLKQFVNNNDYQGALDYFGFKGTYNPNYSYFKISDDPGVTDPYTGNIYYNTTAFENNFDRLYFIADHEMKHRSDVLSGKYKNVEFNDAFVAGEEFNTYEYNYKRQGLYPNSGFNIKGRLNMYGTAAGLDYNMILKYSYSSPWYYFIYKIPRKW